MTDLRTPRPWGQWLAIGLAGIGLVIGVGVPVSGAFSRDDRPARLEMTAALQPRSVPLGEVSDRVELEVEAMALPMVEPVAPPLPERIEHSFEERVEVGAVAALAGRCSVHAPPDRSEADATSDRSSGRGCGFVAGADGGYRARGTWRVEIRRGDEVIVFSSEEGSPECVPIGTIKAGDEVSVEAMTEYGPQAEPSSVDAGDRIGC